MKKLVVFLFVMVVMATFSVKAQELTSLSLEQEYKSIEKDFDNTLNELEAHLKKIEEGIEQGKSLQKKLSHTEDMQMYNEVIRMTEDLEVLRMNAIRQISLMKNDKKTTLKKMKKDIKELIKLEKEINSLR